MTGFVSAATLADLLGLDRTAIWYRLRRSQSIRRRVVTTKSGRHLEISVEDIIAAGWITEEQLKAAQGRVALSRQTGTSGGVDQTRDTLQVAGEAPPLVPSEGNRLLASTAVRKQFQDLSVTEIEILDRINPRWAVTRPAELVRQVSRALQVSKSWLYRDHSQDRRKSKPSALERIPQELRTQLIQYRLKMRTTRTFVECCMADGALPRFSKRTWYRIASQLERDYADEITYLRKGPVALRQQTEPILRDRTYLAPLEVIVGDFWRVDRVTEWLDGELVRPSLAVWVDMRSTLIVGAALAKQPNSLGVKASLLDCFLHWGIPEVAYIDNGKEYRAQRVMGREIEETEVLPEWMTDVENEMKVLEHKGILPALGIRSLNAIARNPRAKVIERVFGRGGFTDWAKEFSDYVGARYWEMPEQVKRAIVARRRGQNYVDRVTGQEIKFSDYRTLAASIQMFIEKHNTRASEGFGMDGRSPIQVWTDLVATQRPRRVSVERIAFAFSEGKILTVRKSGHLEFSKHMFYRADALWKHREQRVHVRFNPIDGFWWNRADGKQPEFLPKALYVFDQDGRYIDTAIFVERVHPTEADVAGLLTKTQRTAADARDTVRELAVVDVKTLPKAPDQLPAPEEEEVVKRDNPYRKTFI